LLPFAALIIRSAGGSGSRSAESGASSAVASYCTSSSLSPNASINSCNNTFLDLEADLLNNVLGGLPRRGVNEEVEGEEVVYPKMIFLNLSSMLSQMAFVLSSRLYHLSLGIQTRLLLSLLFGVG
jgi:hypothetical protein